MDLQTRKLEFIQEFLKIQKEETLDLLEKVLRKERFDDQVDAMPAEELSQRIEKSELDFEKGHYKSTSDLLSKYE
ncbi:hypothetical protein SAMN04487907_102395 [Zunongwangia mangrovi]|uniref:Addiction module component n=1 Tax=Zunongwangia mangrovi TaxID=1334022 RepID=A0A1I1GSW2_9FLAO|nr:hypothetical protein [Zunongwangia mangrovi]SFC14591.1 hypothetical protein SAMN04487907_102395 [Zunongwangia mangrovi]